MADEPTFERWVDWVFDHPVQDRAWHWEDVEWLEPSPEIACEYMTRLFENPGPPLERFDDAQVGQGLNLLVSNSCSNHFFGFLNAEVPLEKRLRGLRSIGTLYAELFEKRCTPHLSHIDEPGAGPLNGVCYMWWDTAPIYGGWKGDGAEKIVPACLDVMEGCLRLENPACHEGALHGLGHFKNYSHIEPRCQKIIDGFLGRRGTLREELRSYAMSARNGCVQ